MSIINSNYVNKTHKVYMVLDKYNKLNSFSKYNLFDYNVYINICKQVFKNQNWEDYFPIWIGQSENERIDNRLTYLYNNCNKDLRINYSLIAELDNKNFKKNYTCVSDQSFTQSKASEIESLLIVSAGRNYLNTSYPLNNINLRKCNIFNKNGYIPDGIEGVNKQSIIRKKIFDFSYNVINELKNINICFDTNLDMIEFLYLFNYRYYYHYNKDIFSINNLKNVIIEIKNNNKFPNLHETYMSYDTNSIEDKITNILLLSIYHYKKNTSPKYNSISNNTIFENIINIFIQSNLIL